MVVTNSQELEYPEGHTSRSIYVAMPIHSVGVTLGKRSWIKVFGPYT